VFLKKDYLRNKTSVPVV